MQAHELSVSLGILPLPAFPSRRVCIYIANSGNGCLQNSVRNSGTCSVAPELVLFPCDSLVSLGVAIVVWPSVSFRRRELISVGCFSPRLFEPITWMQFNKNVNVKGVQFCRIEDQNMLFDLPVCANDAETGAGKCLLSVHFDSSSVWFEM